MSKQITNHELAKIVTSLLTTPQKAGELDTSEKFAGFMTSIAQTVCDHCGGEIPGLADDSVGQWRVAVRGNDSLPENGGVWRNYDPEGNLFDHAPSSGASATEVSHG